MDAEFTQRRNLAVEKATITTDVILAEAGIQAMFSLMLTHDSS